MKFVRSLKYIIHLRKLLFVFKLVNYDRKFPKIKTNLKDRDTELTGPLLSIFHGGQNFEKIRLALSKIINEKTSSKSYSLEAMITETLRWLIANEDEQIIRISNEAFYSKFKEVTEAKDDAWDESDSAFYLPDGTKISKYKIINLLKSKFKAKPFRTNQARGFTINKQDFEKISKQYDVIEEIIVNECQTQDPSSSAAAATTDKEQTTSEKKVTEVTEVTPFEGALPLSVEKSTRNVNNTNNEHELHSKDKDVTLSKKEYYKDKNIGPLKDSNVYCNKDNNYPLDNNPNTTNVNTHTNQPNFNTTLSSNLIGKNNSDSNVNDNRKESC